MKEAINLPYEAICGECLEFKKIKTNKNNKPICQSCYRKNYRPKYLCNFCNDIKVIVKIIEDNKKSCHSCYDKYFRPKRKCFFCGRINIIKKIADGKDICASCYNSSYKPIRICSICGNEAHIHMVKADRHICKSCYSKQFRPVKKCDECGIESAVAININDQSFCDKCYDRYYYQKKICNSCGKLGRIEKTINDYLICSSCYNKFYRPFQECYICKETSYVHKIHNSKYICSSCYNDNYRPKQTCRYCGNLDHVYKKINDYPVCQSCARQIEYKCKKCDTITKDYFPSECFCRNCYYLDKIALLIDNCKVIFKNECSYILLLEYSKFIIKTQKSFCAYFHLIDHIDIFLFIDHMNINLSNIKKSLTVLISEFNILRLSNLENFLLSINIISPITERELYVVDRNNLKINLSSSFKEVFERYCIYLETLTQNYKSKGWENKLVYRTLRSYIKIVYLFLFEISNKIESFHEVSNYHVDAFLCKNLNCYAPQLKKFFDWVNNEYKLFNKLKCPRTISPKNNISVYSHDELDEIISGLSNEQVSFRDKVTCFLALFYGIRSFEIAKLKLDDFKKQNNIFILNIRDISIEIHAFLGNLFTEYIENERKNNKYFLDSNPWMFIGRKYNSNLSEGGISSILRKHQINSQKSFSTFIATSLLDNNILPATLVQGLGMSINTIIRYYNDLSYNAVDEISDIDFIKEQNTHSDIIHSKVYYTYILLCNDGSYYTGHTSDLDKRLKEHENGTGSKYTKTRYPVTLVYYEKFTDKISAMKREKQIKKLTVYEKGNLIKKSRMN